MAGSGKIVSGTNLRLLQLGLDKIIQHFDNQYVGVTDKLFTKVSTKKAYYELMQMAGMGIAGRKGESDVISYDSVNQDWDAHYGIYTYEKAARISWEAQEDNLYEDMIAIIGSELVKAHKYNRDYQGVYIFNNATSGSVLWGDGHSLLDTAHPLQAGGTSSNRLSPDLDLSEDAVEQAVLLVDGLLNPDGMNSEYSAKTLVIPNALRFTAERIMSSKYRTSTTNNDIQAMNNLGCVQDYMYWKRLTSNTAWFLTTDAPNGLMVAEREGMSRDIFKDPYSRDTIIASFCRFRTLVGDWRSIVGTVGV